MKHANRACELTAWETREAVEILAAAYAELADFDEAIRWQIKAMTMYRAEEDRSGSVARLDLYRQGKPYRVEVGGSPFVP